MVSRCVDMRCLEYTGNDAAQKRVTRSHGIGAPERFERRILRATSQVTYRLRDRRAGNGIYNMRCSSLAVETGRFYRFLGENKRTVSLFQDELHRGFYLPTKGQGGASKHGGFGQPAAFHPPIRKTGPVRHPF